MNIDIKKLDDVDSSGYESFLKTASGSMFFHTEYYRNVLRDLLSCQVEYFIATQNQQYCGVLPIAVARSDKYGTVANSLPFFGSSAGVAVNQNLDEADKSEVYEELLLGFEDFANQHNIDIATLITSQFDPYNEPEQNPQYIEPIDITFTRDRIAQIVEFSDYPNGSLNVQGNTPDKTPSDPAEITTVEEYLFSKFEKRCRRAIRKSYSAGLHRIHSTNFEPLYEMHKSGMEAKGGTAKPYEFFELVETHVPSDQYELTYATKNGEIIGGLLTFHFKDTIEYHTPAYEYEYRSDQATSFLIFEAMKDAVQSGITYWNFGGTRPSQESLHRFKRGWGAVEYPYHYYGTTFGDSSEIKQATAQELNSAYPWFYVYPFDELDNS